MVFSSTFILLFLRDGVCSSLYEEKCIFWKILVDIKIFFSPSSAWCVTLAYFVASFHYRLSIAINIYKSKPGGPERVNSMINIWHFFSELKWITTPSQCFTLSLQV